MSHTRMTNSAFFLLLELSELFLLLVFEFYFLSLFKYLPNILMMLGTNVEQEEILC